MTVEQLGYRAGVSWLTIKEVEHGIRCTSTTLIKLRRAIDLPEEFGDHEPVPSHRPVPLDRVAHVIRCNSGG